MPTRSASGHLFARVAKGREKIPDSPAWFEDSGKLLRLEKLGDLFAKLDWRLKVIGIPAHG